MGVVIGNVINFPSPYPYLKGPQVNQDLDDTLNQLIRYINTIVYGSNLPAGILIAANNLSDVSNVAASRSNLGLGSAATQSSTAFDAIGAAAAVLASSLQKSSNLSDLTNAGIARTNLGLGSAATRSTTTFDPAGAAASRAAQGRNTDITSLQALSVTRRTTNVNILSTIGYSTINAGSTAGSQTISYAPSVVAGVLTIVKVDSSYNPVILTDGTNEIFRLTSPAVGGFCQSAMIWTDGVTTRVR